MSLTSFTGIIIGALAGGICFVIFGLMHAVHAGGSSMVVILSKLQGRPLKQSLFARILVAAGIILCVVSGIAVTMVLGGIVGGFIEYALINII